MSSAPAPRERRHLGAGASGRPRNRTSGPVIRPARVGVLALAPVAGASGGVSARRSRARSRAHPEVRERARTGDDAAMASHQAPVRPAAGWLRDRLAWSDDRRHAALGGLGRQVGEERLERLGVDRLFGYELLGQGHEAIAVGREDLRRPLVGLVDDRPDLLVDLLARSRRCSCAARRSRGRGRPARRASRRTAGRACRSCRTR